MAYKMLVEHFLTCSLFGPFLVEVWTDIIFGKFILPERESSDKLGSFRVWSDEWTRNVRSTDEIRTQCSAATYKALFTRNVCVWVNFKLCHMSWMDSMIPSGHVYTLCVHAENGSGTHSLHVHLRHHWFNTKLWRRCWRRCRRKFYL